MRVRTILGRGMTLEKGIGAEAAWVSRRILVTDSRTWSRCLKRSQRAARSEPSGKRLVRTSIAFSDIASSPLASSRDLAAALTRFCASARALLAWLVSASFSLSLLSAASGESEASSGANWPTRIAVLSTKLSMSRFMFATRRERLSRSSSAPGTNCQTSRAACAWSMVASFRFTAAIAGCHRSCQSTCCFAASSRRRSSRPIRFRAALRRPSNERRSCQASASSFSLLSTWGAASLGGKRLSSPKAKVSNQSDQGRNNAFNRGVYRLQRRARCLQLFSQGPKLSDRLQPMGHLGRRQRHNASGLP